MQQMQLGLASAAPVPTAMVLEVVAMAWMPFGIMLGEAAAGGVGAIVPWPCSSTYVAGTACEVADAVSTMHRPASASRAWWVSHWCTLRRRCPPVTATRRERLRRRCRVARWPQLMDCLAWQLGHVVCYPRQAARPSASSICKQQAHATRRDRIGPYRAVNKLFTV